MALVEQNYTPDYLTGDRRERAIVLHMVLSLVVGMALGIVGALLSYGPHLIYSLYEPYAFILLVVVVGRTASGLGWATLASALATLGPIVSLLAASIFGSGAQTLSLGSDGAVLNLVLVTLVSFGLLSYFTKREDLRGDIAAGSLAGLVAATGIDKSLPGGVEYVPGFWPWNALIVTVFALGLLLSLRQGGARARSALVALITVSTCFLFFVGL
ncbi:hypothetical protein [Streptosporangium sp. NPDC000396]|uniref:hypothetical protein n=1 Tax=Streptosporangium sp. NPDC000396 TaxID=3366185 RepID=UPI00369EE6EE